MGEDSERNGRYREDWKDAYPDGEVSYTEWLERHLELEEDSQQRCYLQWKFWLEEYQKLQYALRDIERQLQTIKHQAYLLDSPQRNAVASSVGWLQRMVHKAVWEDSKAKVTLDEQLREQASNPQS